MQERLRAALAHIKQAPTLRRLLVTQAVALTFFTFSGPVEVAYAKLSLDAGDSGYGVLVGAWGLGVTIGSIVFARSIERSLRLLLSTATLAVGLAYVGWALAPGLIVACAIGLVGGMGNGVQWAALISAVQKLTPRVLQGRIMGAVESVGAIAPAVGFSLGGAVTALSSPRTAFLVAGVGATLSTIAFLRINTDASAPADMPGGQPEEKRSLERLPAEATETSTARSSRRRLQRPRSRRADRQGNPGHRNDAGASSGSPSP